MWRTKFICLRAWVPSALIETTQTREILLPWQENTILAFKKKKKAKKNNNNKQNQTHLCEKKRLYFESCLYYVVKIWRVCVVVWFSIFILKNIFLKLRFHILLVQKALWELSLVLYLKGIFCVTHKKADILSSIFVLFFSNGCSKKHQ